MEKKNKNMAKKRGNLGIRKNLNSEPRRKFDNPWRYLYAFLIAAFLLVFGFLCSYAANSFEFQRVSALQDDVFYDFYQLQLSHDLFEADICSQGFLDNFGETLDFQASMFQTFEDQFGKNNPYVINRKKYYSLLQLSHLNLMKKVDKNCNQSYNFIIYFYSNDKKYLDDSDRISRLLGYIKKKNPNTLIYSFNSAKTDRMTAQLKLMYDVNSPIMIIVDEDTKLTDIENADEILSLLD